MAKNCLFCGNEFTTDEAHPYQKYCCSTCRKKAQHKRERGENGTRTLREKKERPQKTCGICGNTFTPTKSYPKYCSDDCKDQACENMRRRESEKTAREYKGEDRRCAYCGKEFNTKTAGRSKYCSYDHQYIALNGYPPPAEVVKTCVLCGKEFTTRISRARACPEHVKKLSRLERTYRKRAAYHEPYSRFEIFARDQFTCHICNQPIDMDAVVPDPMSPTIDHVVPLARGGSDTPDNVKAAHFICNSIKSDQLIDTQRGGVSQKNGTGERTAGGAIRAKKTPRSNP